MPDTPANEAVFGRHRGDRGDAAYPQARSMFLTAVATHQIRDCCIMPLACSEHAAVPYLLKRNLGSGDLLLVDRGIVSFALLFECQNRDIQYLVRLSAVWKPITVRQLGPGDRLVEIKACGAARSKLRGEARNAKIVARLLEFHVGDGKLVRILTSLVDPEMYSAHELALEYHRRWECELAFKELKTELLSVAAGKQKTNFRSKSPIGVIQEAWGAVLAHTLVRQMMVEGAAEADVPVLEISFVDSLEVIKLMLPDIQVATGKNLSGLRRQLISDIGLCQIDRPRRPRMCARKVKRKMSNYGLKGKHDGEQILLLKIAFVEATP